MPATRLIPTIRRARPEDLESVIALAGRALGWDSTKPNVELFRWKHLENPFGESPIWLAEIDGVLAGIRVFLRWRFRRPDGSMARAVRAVDTATHPDFQGKGIFSALTLGALDDLRDEGTDFVFNTPNDKSRPGYLKMGWAEVGRIPVHVRLSSPAAAMRMARARVPAEKWSAPSSAGDAAPVVLEQAADAVEHLLQSRSAEGYRTDRTMAYLQWRYSFAPLGYRIMTSGDPADGCCIFRTRRRGTALEATVCELLVPTHARSTQRALTRDVARSTGADYLIFASDAPGLTTRTLPLPRQGPILTWRALEQPDQPGLGDWGLSLGDIELF